MIDSYCNLTKKQHGHTNVCQILAEAFRKRIGPSGGLLLSVLQLSDPLSFALTVIDCSENATDRSILVHRLAILKRFNSDMNKTVTFTKPIKLTA